MSLMHHVIAEILRDAIDNPNDAKTLIALRIALHWLEHN